MMIKTNVNGDKLEFIKQYEGYCIQAAEVNLDSKQGFIINNDSYFDRTKFDSIKDFELAFNSKFNTTFKVENLIEKSIITRQMNNDKEKLKQNILRNALANGKKANQKELLSLRWNIQKDVGGYTMHGNTGYIANIPYEKLYVFNLNDVSQLEVFKELRDQVADVTWCHCGYSGDNVKYVEKYRGESHGWICPKCKRFKQIG